MIQQSQLLTKTMFLEPDHLYFMNSPLVEEQPKMGLSASSQQESKLVAPTLCKKLTKKSISKDSSKPRRQKHVEELNGNQKFGHWTLEENKRYHWFLEIHNQHFLNKHMRRTDKIFKSMAVFVGSREAEQCRSHHQKMEKKHRSICNILTSLRMEHYGSQDEAFLIRDLSDNKVQIIDTILTSRFLDNCEEPTLLAGPHLEHLESDKERPFDQSNQQRKEQWACEQQKQDEGNNQIRLLPVRMDCFDRDMVDLMLSEQAPHNNYLMI